MSNLAQLLDTIARLQNKAVQIDDLHRIVVGKNGSSAGKFRTNPDAGQAMQATTLQLDKILMGKNHVVFVDARASSGRADKNYTKNMLSLESWVLYQFQQESKERTSSGNNDRFVVFTCGDGLYSKIAANNQLLYHKGWQVYFMPLNDPNIQEWLFSSPHYNKRYLEHGTRADHRRSLN